jgi:uncharacterized membrane protein
MPVKKRSKRGSPKYFTDLESIDKKIDTIKLKLVDRTPSHYSLKDVARAFFGSLLIGLTFLHKGALIQNSKFLTTTHLLAIIGFTFVIVYAETYYLGYRRVADKKRRPFGQFIFKRLITFVIVALVVSTGIAYLFGIDRIVTSPLHLFKTIIALSMPCALGACLGDLAKKY